jgi:hypothetical protein
MFSNYADQRRHFDEKGAYDYIDDDSEVKRNGHDKKEVRFREDNLGGGAAKKKKLKSIRMTKAPKLSSKLSGSSIIQAEDDKKFSDQQGGGGAAALSKKKKSSKRT